MYSVCVINSPSCGPMCSLPLYYYNYELVSARMHLLNKLLQLFFPDASQLNSQLISIMCTGSVLHSPLWASSLQFVLNFSACYWHLSLPLVPCLFDYVCAHFFLLQLSGFPDTIGCVDGSYMPIRCPARKVRSVYINRHHYLSLTLQGVCDNKKRFLDASTGYPSKIHDARIFRRSRISSVLPQLCSSKYHIVGDAAYPFREYLMTPIRDYGNLDSIKKTFNARLSGTRVLIENTFGDLKNRFRQLHRLDMWTVDNMSKFIISCCVLHNLCIDCGDLPENLSRDLSLTSQTTNVDSSSSAVQVSSSSVAQQDSLLRGLASIKRDHLMIKMGLQNQQPWNKEFLYVLCSCEQIYAYQRPTWKAELVKTPSRLGKIVLTTHLLAHLHFLKVVYCAKLENKRHWN